MPFYSPVRLSPAVGVTSGAHYRMSAGHSSPPKLRSHDAAHTTDTRSLHMCGLCPSVEWQCCNFEGTECNAEYIATSDAACWKAILISLCSNEFSNIPPKATATLRSPNTRKTSPKVNFCSFFLHLCVFFCTFAPKLANGHL